MNLWSDMQRILHSITSVSMWQYNFTKWPQGLHMPFQCDMLSAVIDIKHDEGGFRLALSIYIPRNIQKVFSCVLTCLWDK